MLPIPRMQFPANEFHSGSYATFCSDLVQPRLNRRMLTAPTKMATPPAITISNLGKSYKLYRNTTDQAFDILGLSPLLFWRRIEPRLFQALSDVNLTINKGERVGIIGRNGAGKTTLLKIITGSVQPTVGTVDVQGNIQALMQVGLGFHPEFTGRDNIEASLLYSGLTAEHRRDAVDEIIDFCELGTFLDQPLKTYSLGMQSRLQFACSTAVRPDILIVDEILGAGDAYFSVKSSARMERLAKSGCTLILVSHATQQVIQFCERAIWIDSGRVCMDGNVSEVVGSYEVKIAREIKQNRFHAIKAEGPESDFFTRRVVENTGAGATSAEHYRETLANGLAVFRWESNVGVKIRDVNMLDADGERHVFKSGQPVEIELIMECETDGECTIYTHVAIFNDVGIRVAWITSPPDNLSSQTGALRKARIKLREVLLSEGNYTLSISIFNGTNPTDISAGTRVDLLARCYSFGVVNQKDNRDRPVFYHPSQWEFEGLSTIDRERCGATSIIHPPIS